MAKRLLAEMINVARIRGLSSMQAYVRAENKPMLRVFENAGFVRLRSDDPSEAFLKLDLTPAGES
jgi:L-amino acid N-acyltransferase YncA